MTHPTGNDACTPAQAAHTYADLGWCVIPIAPGKKHPAGMKSWQDAATTDHSTIDNWWGGLYRGYGVGILTGPRSGIWVFDVDVSDGKPGDQNLKTLRARHGAIPPTVEGATGSEGAHIFYRWDAARPITNGANSNLLQLDYLEKLITYDAQGHEHITVGLDVRAAGGQVVAAPTTHPNGRPYQWQDGMSPWDVAVAEAPDWLYDLLLTQPTPPTVLPTTVTPLLRTNHTGHTDSIADHVRAAYDWHQVLEGDGWTIESTRGGDTHWTRPGKDIKDGSSAVLHEPDGPLVVFTTTRPHGADITGRDTADGSGRSFSMFDYLAAYHHGGDRSALAREARAQLNETTPRSSGNLALAPVVHLVDPAPQQAPASSPLNLPEAFWGARPHLGHIREAAWSRLLSADAVLGVVFARLAAATHPAICIPSIIGASSSLSCYTALTGPPGTGKSTSIGAASDLVPIIDPKVAHGGQLGSGEGLVELYIEEEDYTDDEGKKKTRRIHKKYGAFVTLDEGAALAELGARKGSTVLSTLRSMWTGGPIGQANASAATTRTLRPGGYSLGFVVGIQPSLAGALLSDSAAGTPQRFLWARTTDPLIPAEPVSWPGELRWEVPVRRGEFGAELTVDGWIAREIRSSALARNRGEQVIDSLDAHADLLRLKIAGLLALLDGRQDVTVEDWALAEMVVDVSTAVRTDVINTVRWDAEERARASDRAAARRAVAAASATEEHQLTEFERTLESAARSVAKRVEKDGSASKRDVTQAISGRARKVVSVAEVIDHAVSLGWVRQVHDGSFVPGVDKCEE